MDLQQAMAVVRAAGYRISKPRPRKTRKNRVGPTAIVKFVDGTSTRMSVFCDDERLDYERAAKLAKAAWLSRNGTTFAPLTRAPAIAEMHFERDGNVLGRLHSVTTVTPIAA